MTYRVIQWASGNVGRASLQAVALHPELELAGLLVINPEKAGQDAGALCNRDPMGVAATADVEAILAMDADCVLHMPLPSVRYGDDPDTDVRDICRLLESGKNVITTVGYVYPKAYGRELVDRFESACATGGSSLHGTGVNPGWMGELLPLTMSAMCSRIDQVYVMESTDFSWYPSREVIVNMMGFGKPPAEFDAESKRYRDWLSGLFCESVEMIADGLGVDLDEIQKTAEFETAPETFDIAAGTIEAGTIAAQRFCWSGIAGGEKRIVLEAIYRARRDLVPIWADVGGIVRIEGRPQISFKLEEGWISNGLVGTALHAVHAVPHVCRAEPGIRTFLDLPLITGRHTVAHD
ncbi:MAG TPA: dihydrodipicolinate reductase [Myxococcales bacterium]|nr:dihydrodipicolinate reductase [Myxococcales bacterium]